MDKLFVIKNYIESNYSIVCYEVLNCFKQKHLLIKHKEYDLTILVYKPGEHHFLYGKCEYVISCNYEANKKYRVKLFYHGGGYDCEYTNKNIDSFLSHYFRKVSERQLTIFDID